MEQLQLTYTGKSSIKKIIRVGNVGSGDLEVLLEPIENEKIQVNITTSINNREHIWRSVLERVFNNAMPSMNIMINDFGATPGVIRLRIEQALEQLSNNVVNYSIDMLPESFIEKTTRQRAEFILDDGSSREILGPEFHTISPWLTLQKIVPQTDDGCVVIKGTINNYNSLIVGIEGVFQGGSMGEISGAKMATALDLALRDNKNGITTQVVLLLESGGVRLQEANLGLAAIADIHSSIVSLRKYVPVIGIIAGSVGCFGGMSIAAALCSTLIMTQEARLGLNGPGVIEQETDIDEFDSNNRPFVWSLIGGEQRFKTGMVDYLVNDNAEQIRSLLVQQIINGKLDTVRCEKIEHYRSILSEVNTTVQATRQQVYIDFNRKRGSQ